MTRLDPQNSKTLNIESQVESFDFQVKKTRSLLHDSVFTRLIGEKTLTAHHFRLSSECLAVKTNFGHFFGENNFIYSSDVNIQIILTCLHNKYLLIKPQRSNLVSLLSSQVFIRQLMPPLLVTCLSARNH